MSFLNSVEFRRSVKPMQNNTRNGALAIIRMLLHDLYSGHKITDRAFREDNVANHPMVGTPEAIFRDDLVALLAHMQRNPTVPSDSESNSDQHSPIFPVQASDHPEANHPLILARLLACHISPEIGGLYLPQAIRSGEVGSNGNCRVRNCHICGDDSDSAGAKFTILSLLCLPDGHQSCHSCVAASFEHMSPSNVLSLFGKDVSAHAFALFFPAQRVSAWQGVIDREIGRERLLALHRKQALEATRNEEQDATNDDALRTLAAKEGWMRCPNKCCQVWVSKEEGCHHMTCTLCSQEFCYVCGATWRPRTCKCNPGYEFAVRDTEADARLAATFDTGFNQPIHHNPIFIFRTGRVQGYPFQRHLHDIRINGRAIRRRQRLLRGRSCCPRRHWRRLGGYDE